MTIAHRLWQARALWNLGGLVHRPLTFERAQTVIRTRREARADRFLAFAARYIYGYPRSPYLPLLRHAGCEAGDLAALVRQKGLEPTLESLRREGVYLSFEEFKGRVDVVRNGRRYRFAEEDFDNPFIRTAMEMRTGGTRSRGSPVSVGLKFVEENFAPGLIVSLAALGARTLPFLLWSTSSAAISLWLAAIHIGHPPDRWFTMNDPQDPATSPRLRQLARGAAVLATTRGLKPPRPEFAPVTAMDPVLDALLSFRDRRGGCVILTTPSLAVRLVALARRRQATLEHIQILAGSEPLTPGKAEEISRAGARVGSFYVFAEGGFVGAPCGDAQAPDDMHFADYNMALIQHRRPMAEIGGLDAYMFTSLSDLPPKIMLNVESDDFGELALRRCGCPLDAMGMHRHLANVRSFTKLTGEGSTLLGSECVRVLEEVLPREFGGRSIDYQLLEVEDSDHLTRLILLVSPEVGPVDERRVLERFISEVRATTSRELRIWRQAETVQVIRRHPVATPRGKVLPFHTQALAAFLGPGAPGAAGLLPARPIGESAGVRAGPIT